MMDLYSPDRGGQGTKQNMYRGPLIKHDVVTQGLTVFIAMSMKEDKGRISISRTR